MRRFNFFYFNENNILVKFHLAWTLTALSMVLTTSRVADFGSDKALQTLCYNMARKILAFKYARTD